MPKLITIGGLSYNVVPGHHGRFWNRVVLGNWEPETFSIFDRFITRDTLFVDIGAWIGSTALYGVQLCDRCVAFEPDPVAFRELQHNIAANAGAAWAGRLEPNECAVNKDGASFTLGGSAEGADSMSSALFPDRASQWTVRATRLQDVLSRHRRNDQPVFLKIDIEGGEYDLLPAVPEVIADPGVTSYISFHPTMFRRSLGTLEQRDLWEAPFVDRHLAVIASLPWSRRIARADGTAVERAALERRLRRRLQFPTELLVSAA